MVGTDMRMEMVVSDVPKHKKGCFGARAPRRGERTLERVGDPQERTAPRMLRGYLRFVTSFVDVLALI